MWRIFLVHRPRVRCESLGVLEARGHKLERAVREIIKVLMADKVQAFDVEAPDPCA